MNAVRERSEGACERFVNWDAAFAGDLAQAGGVPSPAAGLVFCLFLFVFVVEGDAIRFLARKVCFVFLDAITTTGNPPRGVRAASPTIP